MKPKKSSFEQVYRAVSEYRKRFPAKPVIYSADNFDSFGWAVFMAGGSLPVLPPLPEQFLADATLMKPIGPFKKDQWILVNDLKRSCIIYSKSDFSLPVSARGMDHLFSVKWIEPSNGKQVGEEIRVTGTDLENLKNPSAGYAVLWISETN